MATITASAGSNNWNTNGAWVGGVQPAPADDVIIPSGAVVSIPNATTVFARSLTVQSGGTFNQFNSATSVLELGDATAGSGNSVISISSGATVNANTGIISFTSTSSTVQTITSGGKNLGQLIFAATCTGRYVLTDALTLNTSFNFTGSTEFDSASYNITCTTFNCGAGAVRTLNLGASAITCANWTYGNVTNLVIAPTTAVVTIPTVVSGFNNVFVLNSKDWGGLSFVVTGGGQQGLNISGAVVRNLTIVGTANQGDLYRIQGNFTCTGTFAVTGVSPATRPRVQSLTVGVPATITAGATNLSNWDAMDIIGAGAASWAIDSGVAGDCLGNSNITFTNSVTQTRDNTAGAWSNAASWTSRVPLPQDDVVINGGSANTTVDVLCMGRNIDFTGYTGTLSRTSTALPYNLFGSMTLSSTMGMGAAPNTMHIEYRGRGTHTITSNGISHFPATSNQRCEFYAPGGSYKVQDDLTVQATSSTPASIVNVVAGTVDFSGITLTLGQLSSSTTTSPRTIDITNTTIRTYTTGVVTVVNLAQLNLTIVGNNSATFEIINASVNTRSVLLNGASFCRFIYTVSGSTGALAFTSSGNLESLDFSDSSNTRTLQIANNAVLSVTTFNVFGASGMPVIIKSATNGTPAYLSKPTDGILWSPNVDWLSIQDIRMVQPLSAWVGANSTDVSGNMNLYFSTPSGTYRHRQSTVTGVTSTSISAVYPTATTPGSLLVAYVQSTNTTGAVTPPDGWTQAAMNVNAATVFIYYKIADGSEATVTHAQATSRAMVMEVAEYLGFTGTPTLDVTSTNTSSGTVTSLSTNSGVAPSNTNQPALALAFWGSAATLGTTVSLTNNFEEDFTSSQFNSIVHTAVKELITIGAVESTLTWTTPRANTVSGLVVFRDVTASTEAGNFLSFFNGS